MRGAATGAAAVVGAMAVPPGVAAADPAGQPGARLDQLVGVTSLSHINDPATTPIFPGDPAFTLETAASIAADGFYLQYVKEGEHTGTHWGAPGHFQTGGLLADQLDPADLFLPAVKIDVRRQAAANADYALTVADLVAWERRHGPIPRGSAVILWTGWESRWGTAAYENADTAGVTHQPGFSTAAVHWLIDNRRLDVRGALGTDTFGPDLGTDSTFAASTLLYDKHRISLENMNNLASIPETGAYVLVGGPRNKAGSGSPATIFGLVPRQ